MSHARNETNTLGGFLKQRRKALKLTLREFCSSINLDPSNYSKYERDVGPAPGDDVLRRIARKHRIQWGRGAEWKKLEELAAARRFEMPEELRTQRVMELLPAFYQHLRDYDAGEGDQAKRLVRVLRKVV